MSTLNEISVSTEENYRYWSARAKFSLTCLKEAKSKRDIQQVNMYTTGFKNNMANRRNKMYLNEDLRYPLPPIEY